MQIAVEGCCHGDLDEIYAEVANLEQQQQCKVDLLLIGGDFQAVRNHNDLQCMSVPNKFKEIKGFYKCVFELRGCWNFAEYVQVLLRRESGTSSDYMYRRQS
jgi:hypothetical protein